MLGSLPQGLVASTASPEHLPSYQVGEVGAMPGKVQNPHSWFYQVRVRAGFRNAASLAQRLGVPKGMVYQWEHGSASPVPSYRPSSDLMPQLATILNVTLPELVEALYRETLGDPCPCGCGGRKALSDSPTAHKLVIKLP